MFKKRNEITMKIDGKNRQVQDSLGRTIGGADLIKQEAFWRWAGDTKILSEGGCPLVLFHGTSSEIDEFRRDKAIEKDAGWYGAGIYFTADPASASAYSGFDETQQDVMEGSPHLIAVYLAVENPYVWPNGKRMFMTADESSDFTAELIAAGYDGIVIPNDFADPPYAEHFEVVVFRPEQIKSATGNPGTYMQNDPSITDGHRVPTAPIAEGRNRNEGSRRFRP